MKWKSKVTLNMGETRIRAVFAITPRLCIDGYTRWLCRVQVVEKTKAVCSSTGEWSVKWAEFECQPFERDCCKVGGCR